MAFPKVKLSDDSGNTVDVTNNALDVNVAGADFSGDINVHLTAATDDVLIYGYDTSDNQKILTHTDGSIKIKSIADSVSVTNAGTFAVQIDGDALTSLQLIDDTIGTSGFAGPTKAISIGGTRSNGSIKEILVGTDGEVQVDVVSSSSIAVTNAGTFATQVDGDALTALQLIDDAIHADDGDFTLNSSKGIAIMAFQGTQSIDSGDVGVLRCNATGALKVDIASVTTSTGYIPTQGDVTFGAATYAENSTGGRMAGAVRSDSLSTKVNTDNELAPLQVNATGALYVDVADGGQLDTIIDTLETTLTAIETDQAAIETLLGTIDSDTDAIKTAVELIDDAVADEGAALGKGILMQADDGSDRQNLQMTGTGYLKVHLQSTAFSAAASNPFKADKNAYTEADIGVSAKAKRSDVLANLTNVANDDWTSLQVSDTGALYTTHGMTGMVQGIATVGTGAVQLDGGTDGYDIPCKRIDIRASDVNTGNVYVGSADTIASNGSVGGIKLAPGDYYSFDINNLTHIWAEASAADCKLQFIYYT